MHALVGYEPSTDRGIPMSQFERLMINCMTTWIMIKGTIMSYVLPVWQIKVVQTQLFEFQYGKDDWELKVSLSVSFYSVLFFHFVYVSFHCVSISFHYVFASFHSIYVSFHSVFVSFHSILCLSILFVYFLRQIRVEISGSFGSNFATLWCF